MNLLNEYKKMSLDDRKEFIKLIKKDFNKVEIKYTYDDLIELLKEKKVDIDFFFTIIDKSDEILKVADALKNFNKKD